MFKKNKVRLLQKDFINMNSEEKLSDAYKRLGIDSEKHTVGLMLQNCVGLPVGIPHKDEGLSV